MIVLPKTGGLLEYRHQQSDHSIVDLQEAVCGGWMIKNHFEPKFMFYHRVKDLPVAEDQAHITAPVGHETVEVVDDVLFGQKFQN